jgi:hypothetical protein
MTCDPGREADFMIGVAADILHLTAIAGGSYGAFGDNWAKDQYYEFYYKTFFLHQITSSSSHTCRIDCPCFCRRAD